MTEDTNTAPAEHQQTPSDPPALDAGQAQALLAELVKHGALTQEAANEKLSAAGIPIEPDTRSEKARESDDALALGGAKPKEYRLDLGLRFPGRDPAAVLDANRELTGFLSAAALPKGVGEDVAERILNTASKLKDMSEPERGLWEASQRVELARFLGPDYMQRVNAAVPYLNRVKGSFTDALGASGVLKDAGIITQLVLHAERLAARQKM